MTMLSRAVASHAKSLERAASVSVTVRRGPRVSLALTAIPASSVHDSWDAETGIPTKVKSFDWIVAVASLATACAAFPGFSGLRTGDVIVQGEQSYEIVPPAANKPATEPHDRYGVMVVAHSKEIT